MRKLMRVLVLTAVLTATLVLPREPVHSQVGPEALQYCVDFAFSTEEDFVTTGSEPADGNPIISDGDLLSPNGMVCARNSDLLHATFDVVQDLGLDAVDVLDVDDYLVAFSTEIDSPHGDQFTAGDLLATDGSIIPNLALTYQARTIGDIQAGYDMGLDAVHFTGDQADVLAFLAEAGQNSREYWLANPEVLYQMLNRNDVDIWFSTEGTAPTVEQPGFLDGDLLSAATGLIVAANNELLPPEAPAGIPSEGVDFGLDAFSSLTRQLELALQEGYFSTEILYNDPAGGLSFTDGDALRVGNGIAFINWDVIAPFKPRARELGLDALTFIFEPIECDEILEITEVGGIKVGLIDPATGYARKMDGAYPPMPPPNAAPYDRPFGQWVSVRGNVPDPVCVDVGDYEYRVEYQESGGGWVPILTPGLSTPAIPGDDWRAQQSPVFGHCPVHSLWQDYVSDANGWISLEDYWRAEACADQALNVWNTSGEDGSFKLRLGLRQVGMPATEVTSPEVAVFLDNTRPDPVQMTLYDAAGTIPLSDQCKVTGTGDIVISIKGQARDDGQGAADDGDEHFRVYQLHWTGGDLHSWAEVPLSLGEPADYRYYDSTRLDLNGSGTLPPTATDVPLGQLNLTAEHNTWAGVAPPPCGYTLRLRAWDRTVRGNFDPSTNWVNDGHEFGWYKDYMQSFCFEPNGG